jgi:GNAT superfamily N-acetyltransferase
MPGLTFTSVVADEEAAQSWRLVHNEIIPAHPLTLPEVVARSSVNLLELAVLDGAVVGCSTVRPATDDEPVTVIVRILPRFRREGLGSAYLAHVLGEAERLGAQRIQTIVHGSNVDGLTFALHRGFVEAERYTLDGETVPYIHLARQLVDPPAV